jgi:hypothetical protein
MDLGTALLMGHVQPGHSESLPLPVIYGTAQHWLRRAEEAREVAAQMHDPVARQAMLDVATNYETVAKRAEAREAGVDMPNHPKQGSGA